MDKNIDLKDPLEIERKKALESYDILDTHPEKEFDDLTRLAADVCNAPVSRLNLIENNRQWSKSIFGDKDAERETPRDQTVCQYTIIEKEILEVQDLSKDDRFKNFSYVKGKPFLRYYLGAPLLTPEGVAIGALCVLDYQPRKLSDRQKEQLQILVNEVMGRLELRKQNKKLKELNEYKVELMKMLSHDMRSPLNGIMGMASLLKEVKSKEDSEEIEMLSIIEESSVQLNHMIDEIMSYTLMESEGFILNKSPVDVNALVEGIRRLYLPAAKSKKIDLTFDIKNLKDEAFLDQSKFEQVLGNLLSNAIKFTKTNGTVAVSLTKKQTHKGNKLVLKVTDNGIGMDQEVSDKLFVGVNKRLNTYGTAGEKSTGIGLTIVNYFVDLHNGTVQVESEKDKGTTFTVTIPV
ncbi:MAG: GAF domain-containing sensor histidine kinase [Balneolaceae bacterium]